jgi:predicted enzyme related to lactoylglutathione lyase
MPDRSSYHPGEPTWIDLASSDLDASHAFYTSLFGWTAGDSDPDFGGYGMYTLGGKSVAGFAPLMFPGQPVAWSCYVSVEDADKTAELVKQNSGQVHAEPMDVGDLGRMAFFVDPAGGYLGIWQPKAMTGADVIQEEGTLGWIELSSRDLPGVLDFYKNVFGWSAHKQEDYTEFQMDGGSLAGAMPMPDTVPAEVPAFWMPYFIAADIRAKADQAAGLGATILMPFGTAPGVEYAVLMDPLGASFGLLNVIAT